MSFSFDQPEKGARNKINKPILREESNWQK